MKPARKRVSVSSCMPSLSSPMRACSLSRILKHDFLALDRRERGHPDVDRVAADGEADAAVLREPLLGDVEARHDLEARRDAGDHAAGHRRRVVKHAVDAVAHAHVLALGLEVDVRDPFLDALRDHAVDKLDDGRVARRLADLGDLADVVAPSSSSSIASAIDASSRLAASGPTRCPRPKRPPAGRRARS